MDKLYEYYKKYIIAGDIKNVALLSKLPIYVNNNNEEPLRIACSLNHGEIVKLLLSKGAIATADNYKLFWIAYENKSFKALEALLGEIITIPEELLKMLERAIQEEELGVIKVFIDSGINLKNFHSIGLNSYLYEGGD